MITFCIFTPKQMYTIVAAYFKADDIGIMFFDANDEGIGFVPTRALDMVKIAPGQEINLEEQDATRCKQRLS